MLQTFFLVLAFSVLSYRLKRCLHFDIYYFMNMDNFGQFSNNKTLRKILPINFLVKKFLSNGQFSRIFGLVAWQSAEDAWFIWQSAEDAWFIWQSAEDAWFIWKSATQWEIKLCRRHKDDYLTVYNAFNMTFER